MSGRWPSRKARSAGVESSFSDSGISFASHGLAFRHARMQPGGQVGVVCMQTERTAQDVRGGVEQFDLGRGDLWLGPGRTHESF